MQKAFYSHKTFLNCYPKQPFSTLHLPFAPPLTYCPPKNTAVLLLFALILCCNARASHRFKAFSPPFCAKNRFRLVPPENSAEIYFDRALNRRSQDGVPRAFYVTFCTTQKVTIRSLCREHRGSANLDSACRNGGFARTKLKPFSKKESRFCKPRISAHRQQLCTSPIKSFRRHRRTFPGRFATLYSRFRRMVFLPRQAYARSRKTALLMPSIISAVTFSKMSS